MFSGTAQAEMGTYALALAQFKNAWSDLKEQLGTLLLPVLKDVFEWLSKIIEKINIAFGGGGEKAQLGKQLQQIEDSMNEYARTIQETGMTIEVSPYYKEMLTLEQQRRDILEKIRLLNIQEIENKRKLATETKKDILPLGGKLVTPKGLTPTEQIIRELKAEDEYWEMMGKRANEVQKWNEENLVIKQKEISITQEIINQQKTEREYFTRLAEIEAEATKWNLEHLDQIKESAKAGEILAQRMGEAWNFNIKNIITDSQNMADVLKKVFVGIGDAFTSAISKMISDWMLFGSITGTYTKGKGMIGLLGSILPFQEGGIVTKPTLGLIGEEGPEAVIPLKDRSALGEGKTVVNAFYIYANDPISFRDFIRRNPEAIIEVMSQDSRSAGATRGIIRSVG